MLTIPIYLLILVIFANRYVLGALARRVRGQEPAREDDRPTVTFVVPLYNEGPSIYDTILSLLNQNYPRELLSVVVVDDCSTDDSYRYAKKAEAVDPRITVMRNPVNLGKRKSINRAVRAATAEIIVSVDSDVVVDREAVRHLVALFTRPSIGAVGGRVNVLNPNENWLTRMQTIKYFFGYEWLKNLERSFHQVMCLSGCLTAYRRTVLVELDPILEGRNMLGVPIKYGEDRYLTRQIVKAGYETLSTLDAVCYTKVPSTLNNYFSQQLRWRRSNIIDFFGGVAHVWRLHPLVTLHYTSLFTVLIAYPMVIAANVLDHDFFSLAVLHAAIVAVFGVLYRWYTRKLPASQRVPAHSFLALAVVMPVAYLVLTPLALFTLDSGSWETRKPVAAPAEPSSFGRASSPAVPALSE